MNNNLIMRWSFMIPENVIDKNKEKIATMLEEYSWDLYGQYLDNDEVNEKWIKFVKPLIDRKKEVN